MTQDWKTMTASLTIDPREFNFPSGKLHRIMKEKLRLARYHLRLARLANRIKKRRCRSCHRLRSRALFIHANGRKHRHCRHCGPPGPAQTLPCGGMIEYRLWSIREERTEALKVKRYKRFGILNVAKFITEKLDKNP